MIIPLNEDFKIYEVSKKRINPMYVIKPSAILYETINCNSENDFDFDIGGYEMHTWFQPMFMEVREI